MKKVLILVLLTLISACSGSRRAQGYFPFDGQAGFIDTPISVDEYEISYFSRMTLPTQYMKKMIIIRAAEIGDNINMKYFKLSQVEKQVEEVIEEISATEEVLTEEQLAMRERLKTYPMEKTAAVESKSELYKVKYFREVCDECLSVSNVLDGAKKDGFIRK